ncbi:MAG: PASTA domain-containing protein [Bacteroidales bacterium]
MDKFKAFFTPQQLGFHILLAIGITLILCFIAIFSLKIYTRHGEEIAMPNFIGKDSETLLQEGAAKDFIIVVNDHIYDKSVAAGTVLKQNPEPKELVKKGRKVYLTIASSVPPKVKMPELKDVSQRQAEIMLKALGLELGGIILKPSPFENAVLEQLYNGRSIAPGTEVSVGEKITLVVGKDIDGLPGSDSTAVTEDL